MFEFHFINDSKLDFSIEPDELSANCRLCVVRAGVASILGADEKGVSYIHKLSYLSLLKVNKDDHLPKHLCLECIDLLNAFYSFKSKIEVSQSILKMTLGSFPTPGTSREAAEVYNIKVEPYCDSDNESNDGLLFSDNEESQIKEEENGADVKNNNSLPDSCYVCPLCKRVFGNRNDFLMHRRSEMKRYQKVTCQVCNENVLMHRFKAHKKTHCDGQDRSIPDENIVSHTCDECYETFDISEQYVVHLQQFHYEDKNFFCHICGKGSGKKNEYIDHMRGHKTNDHFVCHHCGKVFPKFLSFDNHLSTHNGRGKSKPKKKLACEACHKPFRSFQTLESHIRCHTGEKPFGCTFCDRRFVQKGQLIFHERLHTGERRYMCDVCKKLFTLNGNLQQHKRTHTGERPYPCDICGKSFYTGSSMRKHRQNHIKRCNS